MAKKARKTATSSSNTQKTSGSGLSFAEKMASVLGRLPEDVELQEGISAAVKEEVIAKADEQTQQLLEELVSELNRLTSECGGYRSKLEKETEQAKVESQRISNERTTLEQNKEAFKKEQTAFKAQVTELDKEKLALAAEQNALITKKRELETQELNAEAGFAKQNEVSLEQLLSKKAELEQSLESLQSAISAEEETAANTRLERHRELLATQQSAFEAIAAKERKLIEQQAEFDAQQYELESHKLSLAGKLAALQKQQKHLDKQAQELAAEQLAAKDRQLEALRERLASANGMLATRDKELESWSDIRQLMGDRSPQALITQLNEAQRQVEQLKNELALKPSGSLQSQYDQLRHEFDLQEQDKLDLGRQVNELRRAAAQSAISVIGQETQEKELRVLRKHKEVLSRKIDELESEVDDLVQRQSSQTAFPAMQAMDNDHRLQSQPKLEAVRDLKQFAQVLQHRIALDVNTGKELFYRLEDIQIFLGGLAMSRLAILQGISGTGKTSLATAFSRAVGGHCTSVRVQAGWRDKEDLLGHYNAFEKKYYEKEAVQGLYRASLPAYVDRPCIILLDEMNLSRPEQYFAEFLSALEEDNERQQIALATSPCPNAPKLLIDQHKLQIPQNVWFIGTANHDETTNEFADKTYDRAHVMELPRNEHRFEIDTRIAEEPIKFSFDSLIEAFNNAKEHYTSEIERVKEFLHPSHSFSDVLQKQFNVGWGNRLERQLSAFIPVVLAAGGSLGQAVDHLITTKVLRPGKVVGRYDTTKDDVNQLIEALEETWELLDTNDKPVKALRLLEKELDRKG
ncbi:AAA family ATPase [Ferrimonas balearica]|uniref:AAA family ATPase n=1 Tax=Ferrimonas balearica TaxID=44012 RepID=UPI001F3D6F52|nr:AAA family ATPase [Ferrimonas balearica]MBY6093957.1 AAA family ATPase [Ferrimonas balearica]